MSTPQSTIYVCSGVRLDSRYTHTILFKTRGEQRVYFRNKVVKTFTAYSFIRRSWNIKVQATMEEAKTWNYLYFVNSANAKYYFYFINNIEYVNDNTVELSLEMDVMQTYLPTTGSEVLDYELLPCFIERQHTESDEIGEHTVMENVELGELTTNNFYKFAELDGHDLRKLCILILATQNPQTGTQVLASKINNVFSGMGVYAVNLDKLASFGTLLKDLDKDVIITMWMYPIDLVEIDTVESTGWNDDSRIIHTVTGVDELLFTTKKNRDIDGYTPINNKLYTFPYNFLYVSNNSGVGAMYHYERFDNDVCQFSVTGGISPDSSTRLTPIFYNGSPNNYEEGITLADYPTCAWNADAYKIWLAQNQNQLNVSGVTAGLTIGAGAVATIAGLFTGGLASVGGVGMMASGASQIANLVAQQKDMQAQPPQAKGNHSININVGNGYHLFTAYFKSVNAEHARIIDDYFSLYGYKINRVQTPNLDTRKHYTYVKTVDCHIEGKLCNEDIVKIESIFDKGITFWNNGDNIAEYSLASSNTTY